MNGIRASKYLPTKRFTQKCVNSFHESMENTISQDQAEYFDFWDFAENTEKEMYLREAEDRLNESIIDRGDSINDEFGPKDITKLRINPVEKKYRVFVSKDDLWINELGAYERITLYSRSQLWYWNSDYVDLGDKCLLLNYAIKEIGDINIFQNSRDQPSFSMNESVVINLSSSEPFVWEIERIEKRGGVFHYHLARKEKNKCGDVNYLRTSENEEFLRSV